MADTTDQERVVKRSWAAPGGVHDLLVRALKILLPAGVGVLLAYLLLSPLSKDREISFLLDKNKVDVAGERLKVQAAQYRGQDNQGRPFTINADRALQATSAQPLVDIDGMSAGILLADGPARIQAPRARYNMDEQEVDVLGPILITAADGYRLETRDVRVDLNKHSVASDKGVEGSMPLGRFTAASLRADLPSKTVVLSGRARLHIVQGGLR